MIKKILFSFLLILFSFFIFGSLSAQQYISEATPTMRIAFINSVDLLESIPGKIEATKTIEELNKKYKDELALMQNDYNNKYTDFLSNQINMAESIKLRRMQELYELEQGINRFMKIAQEDVESQEQNLITPLKEKLKEAVDQVGIEHGYICIYDKSNPSIVFLTPNAIDANPLVKAKLQVKR